MIDWIFELLTKRFKSKYAQGWILFYKTRYKDYVEEKQGWAKGDNIQQTPHTPNESGMSK